MQSSAAGQLLRSPPAELHRSLAISFALAASLPLSLIAQTGTPPQDRPFSMDSVAAACVDRQIQSRVEQGRRTYPEALVRFESGLPAGHRFYVTTRVRDSAGRVEQIFVAVDSVPNDRLFGSVASDIRLVEGYKAGQRLAVNPDSILDWLVSRPDGTEEGNVVGNYLDTLQIELREGRIPKAC